MFKLYDHQVKALEELPAEGGYLAFEQGLGKTATAIKFADTHFYDCVLVICPAVALGVWYNELSNWGIEANVPTGTRKEKAKQIGKAGWIVLNYEALLEPEVERAIAKWKPQLIIIDEAQKIKTATAKRSKAVHRITKGVPTLALSGTPINKGLLDLYSQYKAIDDTIWGGISWTKFKQRYAIMGGYGGYEVIGYNHVDELMEKIKPYTVAARKEDTLDLPEKTFQVVPVTLEGKDWKDYSQMAKEGVLDEWIATTPVEKLLRLSQIAGLAKVRASASYIHDLVETGESVVVYYRFREEGLRLSALLDTPELNGSTPSNQRDTLVQEFQEGKRPIFLAQITAGSTAITLTKASHMVYHSLSYAYEDWAQSQDRIHRIGQPYPCNYYYMTAVGPQGGITVDRLVLNSIDKKEDIAGLITKNPDLLLPKE